MDELSLELGQAIHVTNTSIHINECRLLCPIEELPPIISLRYCPQAINYCCYSPPLPTPSYTLFL